MVLDEADAEIGDSRAFRVEIGPHAEMDVLVSFYHRKRHRYVEIVWVRKSMSPPSGH